MTKRNRKPGMNWPPDRTCEKYIEDNSELIDYMEILYDGAEKRQAETPEESR